jgi:pSer/pThr/pTyr-binding forkhead associated (FHA) protein
MTAGPTEEELEARQAAERLGLPFLVYRDGEGAQKIFALEPGRRSITIGRRDEADVSLPWDPECSRLHAELQLRAGEWTISDDGLSQNGTWVNELRLYGRRRLADGDVVRIGRTLLTFSHPGPVGIGPTLVPGELSATPRFSEQQQRILRALCKPLFDDGEGIDPATDEQVAAATGIPLDAVVSELDHLGRALGLEDMPAADQRAEIALLAMRSGLVSADEGG